MKKAIVLMLSVLAFLSCQDAPKRLVVSLDGPWQIAKTAGELPEAFTSSAPVPGLVDLASPALDTPGTKYDGGWYWYRRTLETPAGDFQKTTLKIFKAMYHTKVYVNGTFVGENYYCFTPSYFDLKPLLKGAGESNEILIGVGCKAQLPDTIPNGHDYEKIGYVPGIYDRVELICSNEPYIENIQCVPQIESESLRVVAEIEAGVSGPLPLRYEVREKVSRKRIASGKIAPEVTPEQGLSVVDFEIGMPSCKLWSPESPFLYELTLSTEGDDKSEIFGMRSFRFDPQTKLALLNGKPYYLRGTNICIFRFFDDPDRDSLPWDDAWTVTLHERLKSMHWNSMRYCIGFPPERWYAICDSLGILLQDEYPYWREKATVTVDQFAEEYRRWMRERWNHPSVVIWDAQNESMTHETGKAIRRVRGLDFSDRPWENGWSEPDRPTDPCETHPYLYGVYKVEQDVVPPEGYLKEFFGVVRSPGLYWAGDKSLSAKASPEKHIEFENPKIINEYAWLWLNRDGEPTPNTERIYEILWQGSTLTAEQRFEIYARQMAYLTEYWRAHRGAAGVMHFCSLEFSQSKEPKASTCDHWADLRALTFEPHFLKYVRPAFSPVGLMLDTWEKEYPRGGTLSVPVWVTNDLEEPYSGEISLTLLQDGKELASWRQTAEAGPYGSLTLPFEVTLPETPGFYQLRGELNFGGEAVFSLRDIPVK